jgi:UDP-glucose 4-epimerase
MKILVTGGAGFIGSHTVVELIESGHIPIIVDNFSNSSQFIIDQIEKITNKKPIFYEGDCNDLKFLDNVFKKENQIDGIIHFAAFKSVGESISKPLEYYKNNLLSLMNVLELVKFYQVKNVVFSSSATVYGEPKENPITENFPRQEAKCPYGNTKIICEDILRDSVFSENSFSAISLRYFNPIGAHSSSLIGELPNGIPNNLVPYITQTAAGIREKLTIFGDDYDTQDGTCIRDFIHVVDLARAHIAVVEYLSKQKQSFYDVFNVGTGKGNSVLELVKTFENVNNLRLNYEIGKRRDGDVVQCWADTNKINNVIGWKSKKTLEDSLKDAWNWQQNYLFNFKDIV